MRVDIFARDVCFFSMKVFDNAITDKYNKIEG